MKKEEIVQEFQNLQQQLQGVIVQKETLKIQKMDVEKALEELNKTKERDAYKIVGGVMIRKGVEEIKKELEETKESLEVRIKSLEKMEEMITQKLKDLESKVRPQG